MADSLTNERTKVKAVPKPRTKNARWPFPTYVEPGKAEHVICDPEG